MSTISFLALSFAIGSVLVKNETVVPITFITHSGTSILIPSFQTVDLAQQATIADLRASTNLVDLITNGFLSVLPPSLNAHAASTVQNSITLASLSAQIQLLQTQLNQLGQNGTGLVTNPISLFCSPSGSDVTGDGTSGNPFQTLTKALAALPAGWTQTAQISLAPGTYPAFNGPINVGSISGTSSSTLQITGTATTVVGPVTSTGGSTTTVVTSGLAISAYRGARLRFITGPNATGVYTIVDNTATTITVQTAGFSGGTESAGGSQFVIETFPIIPIGASGISINSSVALNGLVFRNMLGSPASFTINDGNITASSLEIDFASQGVLTFNGGKFIGAFNTSPYIHDGTSTLGLNITSSLALMGGQFIFRGIATLCYGTMDVAGVTAINSSIVVSSQGTLLHSDSGNFGNIPGSFNGGGAITGGTIVILSAGQGFLKNLDISNGGNHGVVCQERSYLALNGISGSGNAGYGLSISGGSRGLALTIGGTKEIHGTLGDVQLDGVTSTWASQIGTGGSNNTTEFTRLIVT